MPSQYLALAKQGVNDWWRYVIAILFILIFWQIIGSIPLGILVAVLTIDKNPATQFNPETLQFEGLQPLLPYLVLNFSLIALLISSYIAVRFLHQRRFITLINPTDYVRWARLFQGFGVYFLLAAIANLAEAVFFPGSYSFTLDLSQFLVFLPIALVITPLQVSAEEVFFRGYLMQGIALKTRNSLIPVLSSSILFMLPHLLNPEVDQSPLVLTTFYFIFGLFLAFITVKDNGLELAIGAHAANNLFIALIANYSNSALPSSSIFTSTLNPSFSLLSFIVIAIVFCLITFRKKLRRFFL